MSIGDSIQRDSAEFLQSLPVRRPRANWARDRRGTTKSSKACITCPVSWVGIVSWKECRGWEKTLLVRTAWPKYWTSTFRAFQFHARLDGPADILGTNMVMGNRPTGRRVFEFQRRADLYADLPGRRNQIAPRPRRSRPCLGKRCRRERVTVGGHHYVLEKALLRAGHAEPHRAGGETYPPCPRRSWDRFFFQAGGRLLNAGGVGDDHRSDDGGGSTGHTPRK